MTPVREQCGAGPHPVVALHGWFGSATAWGPLRRCVNPHRFRYVFPDFRGYGARRDEPGEHTLDEAAADVLALADDAGFDRFSLVGHSMGGVVMQRVLALAPHRVRGMVGISPVPASGMPFDEASRALFTGAATDRDHRRMIIDHTTGSRLGQTWLEMMVRHSEDNATPQAIADYLTAWSGADFHTEIQGNTVPVKVVVGEHDPAITEDAVRATFGQWYPHCEVDVLGNAGHYAVEETPVALAASIENFLAEV